MTGFGALVKLFLRDLARRKFLWVLAAATLAMVGLTYFIGRSLQEAVGNGQTWEMATRSANSQLDELSVWVTPWLSFATLLFAAQVAPESRRNGTTQFVLSLGVRREEMAAAQFAALAIVIAAGTLIVHFGFVAAGYRVGHLHPAEMAFAWVMLLVPLLAGAAGAFAMSLTLSSFETYGIFIVIPLLASILPKMGRVLKGVPIIVVHTVENVRQLFPDPPELTTWPHLTFGESHAPPFPQWQWLVAQTVAVAAFWTLLGLRLQSRHDFGSRTATK